MTEAMKQSRVEFSRIEVGVIANPRATLKNIRELADDIKQRGLLVPLLVWYKRLRREAHEMPDGTTVWTRYVLLGGHRRHAAISLIREEDPSAFDHVPVVLLEGNESDAAFAAIADNLSREDLTVADLANAVHALKLRNHSQAEIAKRLSKSQAWVSRLLLLRESACEELMRAVGDGRMPFDIALTLCKLSEERQRAALERYLAKTAANGKGSAGRQAKRDAGGIVRPTAKILTRNYEYLAVAKKNAPVRQQSMLGLAERILAYALGRGPWPEELPTREGDDDDEG